MKGYSECQPFLVHLNAEHERLDILTSGLENDLARITDRSVPRAIVEKVSRLRDELAAHFQEEDRGGCLEEAVSRCPRLGEAAAIIDREHSELLQRIGQLIAQAELGDEEFAAGFQCFAEKLRQHEGMENRILMEAFGCGDE